MAAQSEYHRVSSDTIDSIDGLSNEEEALSLKRAALRRQSLFQRRVLACWSVLRILCICLFLATWVPTILLNLKTSGMLTAARRTMFDPDMPKFLPGGHLTIPGWGMIYNQSYCNGLADPRGAIERGCVLDPMQGGWIHKSCHDPELTEEFINLPDFGWYLDVNLTQPIPQEKVWAADIGDNKYLYTRDNFHWRHCEFVMMSTLKNGLSRARNLGFLALDPSHTLHCYDRIVNYNTPELRNETEIVYLGGFTLGGECYQPLPYI